MSSITLKHVTKKFNTFSAVKELNLEIKEGEFFTFLGPSGCGKTTTLRMIAGFYYPTIGTIHFGDKDMTRVAPEKRNTGMVFQNYALFPHMTVFENVAFGLKVRKCAKSEVITRVEEALRKVRLEQLIDRQVSQLSGGQQQRVALARALVIEPDILLLDEPLSNLDARLRDEMREEILRLQREYRITTIYVTHDQVEALTMSDRIAVFNTGECQQVGTPKQIYDEPANDFVASFIGETNLLSIQLAREDDEKIYVRLENDETTEMVIPKDRSNTIKDTPSALSIRPEAVEVSTKELEGANCFQGTIEMVQFTGAAEHLFIKVGEKTIQALVLNNHLWSERKKGESVWIRFPEEYVRTIPKVLGEGAHEK